jgi:hypothetical protein
LATIEKMNPDELAASVWNPDPAVAEELLGFRDFLHR